MHKTHFNIWTVHNTLNIWIVDVHGTLNIWIVGVHDTLYNMDCA